MTDKKYCPFCGDEKIEYIGQDPDHKAHVYHCSECDVYFKVYTLKPPFNVIIVGKESKRGT
jgi:transcription elongation factor Elf1